MDPGSTGGAGSEATSPDLKPLAALWHTVIIPSDPHSQMDGVIYVGINLGGSGKLWTLTSAFQGTMGISQGP